MSSRKRPKPRNAASAITVPGSARLLVDRDAGRIVLAHGELVDAELLDDDDLVVGADFDLRLDLGGVHGGAVPFGGGRDGFEKERSGFPFAVHRTTCAANGMNYRRP